MIADTLATRRFSDGELVVPMTATEEAAGYNSSVRLVRKLQIVGDLAIACAGDAGWAATAVKELRYAAPAWAKEERPLRKLGWWADQKKIEVLAMWPMSDRQVIWRVVPQRHQFQSKHLGLCVAIGSGGKELIEECKRVEEIFDNVKLISLHPFQKVRFFINHLTCIRLSKEAMKEKVNWGGYLEWAYWDNKEWKRGPRAAHLYFSILRIAGLEKPSVTIEKLSRGIAYDPSGEGRILSWIGGKRFEFKLDPIDSIPLNSNPIRREYSDWTDYSADEITLTFIADFGDNFFYPYTLPSDSGAKLKFTENGQQWSIPPAEFDEAVRQVCALKNVEYVDPKDLVGVPRVNGRD